ncbi:hypothetical protein PVAP13_1NG412638 [Panicum virgatum]|uniref:Uncharacterized protein n=1 Tax=Panicum virgatum TaxID=38727 RepID=A0A8T0X1D5_PANVG|nr:hypothetical protein PVAP13_1NG412638 [Panicum virgatum]
MSSQPGVQSGEPQVLPLPVRGAPSPSATDIDLESGISRNARKPNTRGRRPVLLPAGLAVLIASVPLRRVRSKDDFISRVKEATRGACHTSSAEYHKVRGN